MISLFKRIFKETKEPEDLELIEQMFEIKKQFESINLEVQNGLKSELVEEQIAVVDKALEELPRLDNVVRALPPPKDEHRRRYLAYLPEVFTAYVLFCRHCKASLIQNNHNESKLAMSYLKEAIRLLKEAHRKFKL